ncbi:MAG TPA: hypothetical protein VHE55_09735 [Fimbriimonadaceae bacterium]|nr:hypothetical protein [Fimbriimonadaceae bacterium]
MSATRLAILGAGSVRCSPGVIASLATYFGERPLEIRMFDADMERLDLFDRLARVCFIMTKNGHNLISTTDADEALADADLVVLQVGENCARKYLKERHRMGIASLDADAMIEQAVEELLATVPAEVEVLSLQGPEIAIPRASYHRAAWPPEPSLTERRALPHQALRWIRGEEYVHDLLHDFEQSPMKQWLNDPDSVERVGEAMEERD